MEQRARITSLPDGSAIPNTPLMHLWPSWPPRHTWTACCPPDQLQPVLLPGVIPPQVLTLHWTSLGSIQISLNDSTALWCTRHFVKLCTISKLTEVALSLHPSHWWTSWARLDPVVTPGGASLVINLQLYSVPLITTSQGLPFRLFSILFTITQLICPSWAFLWGF